MYTHLDLRRRQSPQVVRNVRLEAASGKCTRAIPAREEAVRAALLVRPARRHVEHVPIDGQVDRERRIRAVVAAQFLLAQRQFFALHGEMMRKCKNRKSDLNGTCVPADTGASWESPPRSRM